MTGRRALRVALGVLTVAALVFVVAKARAQWPEMVETWRSADGGRLIVGTCVFALAELCFALSWPITMRSLGEPVGTAEGAALFAVTQTAKYVPGSVWQAIGRVEAAKRIGIPRPATSASLFLEAGACLLAAGTVGALTGAPGELLRTTGIVSVAASAGVMLVGVAAFAASTRVAKRVHALPDGRGLSVVAGWQLLTWSLYGAAAAVVASALGVDAPATVAGAFCLSWAVGFVVIVAPAGLGVRESVMTAVLAPVATTAAALSVAVGTRVVWTAVQLLAAAVGLGVTAGARRRSAVPNGVTP